MRTYNRPTLSKTITIQTNLLYEPKVIRTIFKLLTEGRSPKYTIVMYRPRPWSIATGYTKWWVAAHLKLNGNIHFLQFWLDNIIDINFSEYWLYVKLLEFYYLRTRCPSFFSFADLLYRSRSNYFAHDGQGVLTCSISQKTLIFFKS